MTRPDSDLILDAGDALTAVRSFEQLWRLELLDELAPGTLETGARLLATASSRALILAGRLERRAAYMREARAQIPKDPHR